jgi:Tol biopolymer transport system component
MPIPVGRLATWSDATQITLDQAYIEAFDLSADGRRLAIQSDRGGYYDIWVLPSSGGEMQRITDDPEPDWWPAWSYDGQQIAFYSNRAGGNRETWVQPLAGGPARQVTTNGSGAAFPRWSRDGLSLFVGTGQIAVVPATGGVPRTLLKPDPNKSLSTMEFSLHPDGRSYAYASGRLPDRRLWRAPIRGR